MLARPGVSMSVIVASDEVGHDTSMVVDVGLGERPELDVERAVGAGERERLGRVRRAGWATTS